MKRLLKPKQNSGSGHGARSRRWIILGSLLASAVLLWILFAPEFIWSRPWVVEADFNELSDKVESSSNDEGDFIVVARDDPERGSELFSISRTEGGWGAPVPLTSINSPFNETDPDLSADGTYLFFASDRPGGAGGFDLWVARRMGRSWGPPLNVGEEVNSRFDEMGPSAPLTADFIVFSSNRPHDPLSEAEGLLSDKELRRQYTNRDMDLFRAPWSGFREGVRTTSYALRDNRQLDETLLERLGGSAGTEAAVMRALAWISSSQEADGRWSNQKHGGQGTHDVAATSLSLLCFLGRGFVHTEEGPYKDAVAKGVAWLVKAAGQDGSLMGGANNGMYDQGMATMALAEAYGLSKDEALREPLQRAVNFIVKAQNPQDGGWRYSPGQAGDTSVFGWQIMALHSAKSVGIEVPEQTFEDAKRWLSKVSGGRDLGLYGYQGPQHSETMTAEGMFCAQLLGYPRLDARMYQSAEFLGRMAMKPDDGGVHYYIYYSTLSLYHHHGDTWNVWNRLLKEFLLDRQVKQGDLKGTWKPEGKHGNEMGTLTTTALATLALEVYYRYLPRYEYLHPIALDEDALAAGQTNAVPGEGSEALSREESLEALRKEAVTIPNVLAATRIERLNTPHAEAQPALARDGRTLVFASNRHGTRGGADLFQSTLKSKGFGRPKTLVGHPNSIADETDPAFFQNGERLLFSSNRESPSGQWYRLYEAERLPFSLRRAIAEAFAYLLNLIERVKWWLLAAIVAGLAILYLLRQFGDAEARRKMTLLHRCLLVSLLIHLLGLVFAAFYKISSEVKVAMQEGVMEVAVDVNALAQEKLALDIREDITEMPDTGTESIAEQADIQDEDSEAVANDIPLPEFEAQTAAESFTMETPAPVVELREETLDVPLPDTLHELAPLEAIAFEMAMEEQTEDETETKKPSTDEVAAAGAAAEQAVTPPGQEVAPETVQVDASAVRSDMLEPVSLPETELTRVESYHDETMADIQRNFTNAAHLAFSIHMTLEELSETPAEETAATETPDTRLSGAEPIEKQQDVTDVLIAQVAQEGRVADEPVEAEDLTVATAALPQEATTADDTPESRMQSTLASMAPPSVSLEMETGSERDSGKVESAPDVASMGLARLDREAVASDSTLPTSQADRGEARTEAEVSYSPAQRVDTKRGEPVEAKPDALVVASVVPNALPSSKPHAIETRMESRQTAERSAPSPVVDVPATAVKRTTQSMASSEVAALTGPTAMLDILESLRTAVAPGSAPIPPAQPMETRLPEARAKAHSVNAATTAAANAAQTSLPDVRMESPANPDRVASPKRTETLGSGTSVKSQVTVENETMPSSPSASAPASNVANTSEKARQPALLATAVLTTESNSREAKVSAVAIRASGSSPRDSGLPAISMPLNRQGDTGKASAEPGVAAAGASSRQEIDRHQMQPGDAPTLDARVEVASRTSATTAAAVRASAAEAVVRESRLVASLPVSAGPRALGSMPSGMAMDDRPLPVADSTAAETGDIGTMSARHQRSGVRSRPTAVHVVSGTSNATRAGSRSGRIAGSPGKGGAAAVSSSTVESELSSKDGLIPVAFLSGSEPPPHLEPAMVVPEAPSPYVLRRAPDRALVLKQTGGGDDTEAAVQRALAWLTEMQETDGSWSMDRHGGEPGHDVGATALSLLAYMGSGANHLSEGPYQDSVARALAWLQGQMKKDGDLREANADNAMYSQAIGTLALCEAYALTRDPELKSAAQAAISFVIKAQNPDDGGWRYYPKEAGDTSVFGWQFMALKSARDAGLQVPESSLQLCSHWLSQVGGGEHGGLYGYRDKNPLASLVSVGLFSRQLMGAKRDDPQSLESVASLKGLKPELDNDQVPTYFQVYYTTLALFQQQGPEWETWNKELKREMLAAQEPGGEFAGSWSPRGLYAERSGRVVSTAMAALTLEVYYRYLPVYGISSD